jgi:hypothetical protein
VIPAPREKDGSPFPAILLFQAPTQVDPIFDYQDKSKLNAMKEFLQWMSTDERMAKS